MMEHLSTLFYRLLMHSSICILEEFNFFLFIYLLLNIGVCKINVKMYRNGPLDNTTLQLTNLLRNRDEWAIVRLLIHK